MEIRYLDWDSRTFGYKIGVVVMNDSEYSSIRAVAEKEEYKLVYVRTSADFADHALINDGGILVDEKIHYQKCIVDPEFPDRWSDSSIHTYDLKECTPKLLQLTLESGIHSRFKKDIGFIAGEFETLYRIWIGNAAKRGNIFICVIDNKLAGFVSYKLYDTEINIELIAVDPTFRGHGVATQLMRKVEIQGMKNKVGTMTVDTQRCNNTACIVYEKFGFQKSSIEKIYHLWTN